MEKEISKNVIPLEGQVTLPIAGYHQLLDSASKLDLIISEKEKDFQEKLDEKEKQIIEEQKKLVKLQERAKKALKIISDNIAKLDVHGEKQTRRVGMLQEAILEGLDVVIEEFDNISDDELKDKKQI